MIHDKGRVDKIIEALTVGCSINGACNCGGIHKQTFFNWFNRGEKEANRVKRHHFCAVKDKEKIYVDFFDQVTAAEGELETVLLGHIQKAALSGKWQAAAWILERRKTADWGRVHKDEGRTPKVGQTVHSKPSRKTPDLRNALDSPDALMAARTLLKASKKSKTSKLNGSSPKGTIH